MNITVAGPGALGCLFAALLAKANNTVWLLDHNEARAALFHTQGILLETPGQEFRVPVSSTADPRLIANTDVILLCVKSYDVAAALKELTPLLANRKTLLIAMQNGIAHHEVLSQAVQFYAVGITAQGGTLAGPGKVVHGGSGQTVLGYLPGQFTTAGLADNIKLLQSVAKIFSAAQLPTVVSTSITNSIWDKLIINVGINALTAINNCPNGQLLANPSVVHLLAAAVREAASVATALGISLSGDPLEMTVKVCRATSCNISSMLQDVRQKRRTEIDAINGAIVREGNRLGIPTPVNQQLVAAVKALAL
jgi:2-dehydropantoate 2-reductase